MKKRLKLLFIVNDPHPLKYFLKEHLIFLKNTNMFDITVLFNTDNYIREEFLDGIDVKHIKISRKPNIIKDLGILLTLIFFLLRNRFDIVHSLTPKSGLLSSVAGIVARVPIRIHTFTGQVWANYEGFKRVFYICLDKIICTLNNNLLADSLSQRDFLLENNVVSSLKISVLGKGSICGVNLKRFTPKFDIQNNLKAELNIAVNTFVLVFVGRINKDKGVLDLIQAFKEIPDKDLVLLIIGNDEERLLAENLNEYFNLENKRLFYFKETNIPEKYMSLADVICLPSYREGFGNVIIEAASVGTPAIVSDIYGLEDSVIENITGVRFKVGNVEDLVSKIIYLKSSQDKLLMMSKAAIDNVRKNFDSIYLTKCLFDYYLDKVNLK